MEGDFLYRVCAAGEPLRYAKTFSEAKEAMLKAAHDDFESGEGAPLTLELRVPEGWHVRVRWGYSPAEAKA